MVLKPVPPGPAKAHHSTKDEFLRVEQEIKQVKEIRKNNQPGSGKDGALADRIRQLRLTQVELVRSARGFLPGGEIRCLEIVLARMNDAQVGDAGKRFDAVVEAMRAEEKAEPELV